MLLDSNRARALVLLRDSGLLPHVLPEIAELSSAQFDETLRVLSALCEPSLPLALAALLSWEQRAESGEPEKKGEERGAQSAEPQVLSTQDEVPGTKSNASLPAHVGRRLRFTNKEIERCAWLLANLEDASHAQQLPWPRVQRILTHDGAAELVALHEAVAGSADVALAFCRERLAWPPDRLNPPPLIDGAALIEHGLAPGPSFAQLLEQVRDAQLEGRIQTRGQALALVDRLRSM
jgi:poly(A) polymerase